MTTHALSDRVRSIEERDRHYQAMWRAERPFHVTHFYSLGDMGRRNVEFFSYGYTDAGGNYYSGLTVYDGEQFLPAGRVDIEPLTLGVI